MNVLGIISSAIGITLFIGTAVIFLRGSADKGTIESQTRSITALKTELEIAQRDRDTERAGRLAAETKLVDRDEAIEGLRAALTQRAAVAELRTTVEENHQETMVSLVKIERAVVV